MKSVISIGEIARQAGVGVETVRFYERRGLLAEPQRKASGYRTAYPNFGDHPMLNIRNNSTRVCLTLVPAVLVLVVVGCQRESAAPPAEDHSKHAMGHAEHGEHSDATARLMVATEPTTPVPNAETALRLEIMDASGARVKSFATLHDKLVHLIGVRDGLDHEAGSRDHAPPQL